MSKPKCQFHRWAQDMHPNLESCRECGKTRPVKKPKQSSLLGRQSLGEGKPRKPLKRGRKKREFAAYPGGMEGGCLFTGPDCGGPVTRHHLVSQQRIRSVHASLVAEYRRKGGESPWGLGRCLGDPRNLVLLCWDHHQRVENRVLDVGPCHVPAGFDEFVAEYGLDRAVPETFNRRSAA